MAPDPEALVLRDDGQFPNSELPLLLYRGALSGEVTPEAFERLFGRNGWPAEWRDSVFTYHHYHSKGHEVLGVAAGEATLMFGGPQGVEVHVKAGDAVVIPAGVAHRRLVASEDFLVVGGYPSGQESVDLLRGSPHDRPKADHNITRVPLPDKDPIRGELRQSGARRPAEAGPQVTRRPSPARAPGRRPSGRGPG